MIATTTRLLFGLWLWICGTAAAFAQDVDITLKLHPAQVVEIERLMDRQPTLDARDAPPPAYWELKIAILGALAANPDANRAALSLLGGAR
jgi:hypothetical protein